MNNEIAFSSENNALEVARILIREDYVVMLSREEKQTVLNFEYSRDSDRNGVIFKANEEDD